MAGKGLGPWEGGPSSGFHGDGALLAREPNCTAWGLLRAGHPRAKDRGAAPGREGDGSAPNTGRGGAGAPLPRSRVLAHSPGHAPSRTYVCHARTHTEQRRRQTQNQITLSHTQAVRTPTTATQVPGLTHAPNGQQRRAPLMGGAPSGRRWGAPAQPLPAPRRWLWPRPPAPLRLRPAVPSTQKQGHVGWRLTVSRPLTRV